MKHIIFPLPLESRMLKGTVIVHEFALKYNTVTDLITRQTVEHSLRDCMTMSAVSQIRCEHNTFPFLFTYENFNDSYFDEHRIIQNLFYYSSVWLELDDEEDILKVEAINPIRFSHSEEDYMLVTDSLLDIQNTVNMYKRRKAALQFAAKTYIRPGK